MPRRTPDLSRSALPCPFPCLCLLRRAQAVVSVPAFLCIPASITLPAPALRPPFPFFHSSNSLPWARGKRELTSLSFSGLPMPHGLMRNSVVRSAGPVPAAPGPAWPVPVSPAFSRASCSGDALVRPQGLRRGFALPSRGRSRRLTPGSPVPVPAVPKNRSDDVPAPPHAMRLPSKADCLLVILRNQKTFPPCP